MGQPGLRSFGRSTHTMTLFGLLVFSIAGTFSFAFDTVNTFMKAKGRKHVTQDYAGLVPMWLEDVPLACLNVFIAPCSWATAKVTQLVAVAVAAIVCLFKFFKLLFNFCFRGTCCERPVTSVLILALAFFGTGIVFCCSIAVFVRNLQQLQAAHSYGLQNAYVSMPSTYQKHVLANLEDITTQENNDITYIEYVCNRTLNTGVIGTLCPPEFEDPSVESIIFGFEYILPSDKIPYGNIVYDTKLRYFSGKCETHGKLESPSYLWYCVKDQGGYCTMSWERNLCKISTEPAWEEEVSMNCNMGQKIIEQR
ncbi:uncharacterized protein [Ptychodera flava]|uniref:uncharacterized protein n=1 Tax=Ptychodera flava TaxID=63121 RepID=UPI00396A179B